MVRKKLFSQLNELVGSEVNFGKKSKVSIIAKGNINKHSKDGANFTKVDVFFFFFEIFFRIFSAWDN